jgi:hypothetical protein
MLLYNCQAFFPLLKIHQYGAFGARRGQDVDECGMILNVLQRVEIKIDAGRRNYFENRSCISRVDVLLSKLGKLILIKHVS